MLAGDTNDMRASVTCNWYILVIDGTIFLPFYDIIPCHSNSTYYAELFPAFRVADLKWILVSIFTKWLSCEPSTGSSSSSEEPNKTWIDLNHHLPIDSLLLPPATFTITYMCTSCPSGAVPKTSTGISLLSPLFHSSEAKGAMPPLTSFFPSLQTLLPWVFPYEIWMSPWWLDIDF